MTTPSELAAIRERWAGVDLLYMRLQGGDPNVYLTEGAANGRRLVFAKGTDPALLQLVRGSVDDIHTLLAALDAACAERDTALSRVAALEARMRELEDALHGLLVAVREHGDDSTELWAARDDGSAMMWKSDRIMDYLHKWATEANTPPPSTPSRRRVDSERAAPVGERLDGKQEDSCR